MRGPLASLSRDDGRKMGRSFAVALVSNVSAEAAVDEWVHNFPALGELEVRTMTKVVTDFTGVLLFRLPDELGGCYYMVNLVLNQLSVLGCIIRAGVRDLLQVHLRPRAPADVLVHAHWLAALSGLLLRQHQRLSSYFSV